MDVTFWTELISTVGFPIALVIAMGIFIWIIYKQSVAREDKLMKELAECRKVNNKAIETLAIFTERLGTMETDIKEIKDIISQE